jgi:hypothetical protein
VGALAVVVDPPQLDLDAGSGERGEVRLREALVAEVAVEPLGGPIRTFAIRDPNVTTVLHSWLTMRRMAAVADEVRACIASLRRIARNVKRRKGEGMICRWVALGVAEAQRGFRRMKGHKDMPALVAALRPAAKIVAPTKKVA